MGNIKSLPPRVAQFNKGVTTRDIEDHMRDRHTEKVYRGYLPVRFVAAAMYSVGIWLRLKVKVRESWR